MATRQFIAGGDFHTIALKAGTVLAWGYNGQGQCNIPADANSGVSAIAGGGYHTIALSPLCVNIANHSQADCDNDGIGDACEIANQTATDCNLNGVPDSCDIAVDVLDVNSDGRIDACNYALGDFDLDNVVNSADLGFCLIFYGETDPPFGDLNASGVCDSEDLGQLLGNYGILP